MWYMSSAAKLRAYDQEGKKKKKKKRSGEQKRREAALYLLSAINV